jgi:ribosomal protein L20A (L18A)
MNLKKKKGKYKMKDKNNKHIVNVHDLLAIEFMRMRIKHPCDININEEGKLLTPYFSMSKNEYISLLDMPLPYMVRAFNRTLIELNNLKENRKEGKKFKVTLNTDETYSKIVEAQDLEKAREKAYNQFFIKGGNQMKLEDQNIDIIDIEEVK